MTDQDNPRESAGLGAGNIGAYREHAAAEAPQRPLTYDETITGKAINLLLHSGTYRSRADG